MNNPSDTRSTFVGPGLNNYGRKKSSIEDLNILLTTKMKLPNRREYGTPPDTAPSMTHEQQLAVAVVWDILSVLCESLEVEDWAAIDEKANYCLGSKDGIVDCMSQLFLVFPKDHPIYQINK